ncbi:MAG TPA: CatB-related O-acetyltransferase [Afipia sp.]
MTRGKIVKYNDPNIAGILLDNGINHDLGINDFKHVRGRIEAPTQISGTKLRHDFSFGAFSYVTGGFLFHTHIGRYCSLSNGLHIGQEGHPVDWLSTNPFQYQRSPFLLGPDFEDRNLFEQDVKRIDQRLSRSLRGKSGKTIIGNDVWIAHGVYIKNGVTIGDGAVIGARSVVTSDIPPYSVAFGSPARIKRMRFSENIIDRLTRSKWWEFAPWQLRGVTFDQIDKAIDEIDELRLAGTEIYSPQFVEIS